MRTFRQNCSTAVQVLLGLMVPAIFLAVTLMPSTGYAQEDVKTVDSVKAAAGDGEIDDQKNLRTMRYYYKAFNRRDPFQSLVVGEFEETEYELVDIYGVRMVGVLSGGMEKYAMLEDNNGYGYILKAGDPVRNGSIVSVGERSIVARVSMFGQTTSVTLQMEGKKGKGE